MTSPITGYAIKASYLTTQFSQLQNEDSYQIKQKEMCLCPHIKIERKKACKHLV